MLLQKKTNASRDYLKFGKPKYFEMLSSNEDLKGEERLEVVDEMLDSWYREGFEPSCVFIKNPDMIVPYIMSEIGFIGYDLNPEKLYELMVDCNYYVIEISNSDERKYAILNY